jgi:DnaK suppressor protein
VGFDPPEIDMNKAQLAAFRKQLEGEREGLLREADSLEEQRVNSEGRSEMRDAGSHQADVATEAFEDELADSLSASTLERRQEIDEALARIDDGKFGKCVECGNDIPTARLEARPWAARCINCQEQLERDAARSAFAA